MSNTVGQTFVKFGFRKICKDSKLLACDRGLYLCRVRRRSVRLCHCKTRPNFAFKQRQQVLLLLLRVAKAQKKLHVACVGRTAVEHLIETNEHRKNRAKRFEQQSTNALHLPPKATEKLPSCAPQDNT
jgi:hypothetical protein